MTDKSKITVVSLGPGPRAYLTLGVLDALKKAEQVILRTSLRCDAADAPVAEAVRKAREEQDK